MALVPGSFNADLPGYQIKFEEKYGEQENLLKKVLIYDLKSNRGNQKVITADRGKIVTEEGSRYMTFILYDGNYYEEHVKNARTTAKRKKMAASNATFKELLIIQDIGPRVASKIKDYFDERGNQEILENLLPLLEIILPKSKDKEGSKLSGLQIAITGKLISMSRDELKDILLENGAKVTSSISKNTNYLVAGENAGSKLTKAKELDVKILEENDIGSFLNDPKKFF